MSVFKHKVRHQILHLKIIQRITSFPNNQFTQLLQVIRRKSTDILEENNQDYHWIMISILLEDPINSLRMLYVQKRAFNCINRICGISVILLK
jgi:hypothetical protein